MSIFRRRRNPNLQVVDNESHKETAATAASLRLREIIITSAITALAVAVVGDIYRGAKKKVLNRDTNPDNDDEMMRMLYVKQQLEQQPSPTPAAAAALVSPASQASAQQPSWERALKDRAEALKKRQHDLDEREDELLARERRARLMAG